MAPASAVPSLEELRALPKVELHAHLSGCISQQKLTELLGRKGGGDSFAPFDCRKILAENQDTVAAMAKCFDYFDKVAQVVRDLATLKECALHVLDCFAADGCLYLELRTSPKQLEHKGAVGNAALKQPLRGKMQYLRTVEEAVDEFKAYSAERFGYEMDVGVLLSVDRGKIGSIGDALQQLDDIASLADAFPDLVVGIDVCGNPATPSVVPYLLPAMQQRRALFQRLPVTFHTAEAPDEEECELILRSLQELNIRRLGHVCFLPPRLQQELLEGSRPVCVELCPTSNSVTRRLTKLEEHHFPSWWRKSSSVKVGVCTDDTGLFSCSLSSELHDVTRAFNLTREDVVDLQRQALASSFHPHKARLLARFEALLASGGRRRKCAL